MFWKSHFYTDIVSTVIEMPKKMNSTINVEEPIILSNNKTYNTSIWSMPQQSNKIRVTSYYRKLQILTHDTDSSFTVAQKTFLTQLLKARLQHKKHNHTAVSSTTLEL